VCATKCVSTCHPRYVCAWYHIHVCIQLCVYQMCMCMCTSICVYICICIKGELLQHSRALIQSWVKGEISICVSVCVPVCACVSYYTFLYVLVCAHGCTDVVS